MSNCSSPIRPNRSHSSARRWRRSVTVCTCRASRMDLAPTPRIWTSGCAGAGLRSRCHMSPSTAPAGLRSKPATERHSARVAVTTARRNCCPTSTRTTTPLSCATRTATISSSSVTGKAHEAGQVHFSIYPTLERKLTKRRRATEARESHCADPAQRSPLPADSQQPRYEHHPHPTLPLKGRARACSAPTKARPLEAACLLHLGAVFERQLDACAIGDHLAVLDL